MEQQIQIVPQVLAADELELSTLPVELSDLVSLLFAE